jgi:MoxR-like ATPase
MGTIEQQIVNVVENHLSSDNARAAMESNVESLLNKWGIDKSVKTIEVKQQDKEPVKVGLVHFKFETILKSVSARVNIALVGAAGSGKTTTAAKVAKALGLDFYSKSVSAQTGAHEFFGYQDANGNYVRTLFRDAYENGGVFLLDEFDAGNPNVLAALNQATANDSCAFADGMIPKHDDFVCIMAGNTYGHGANSEYVGRNKIDAATLDRFAFIDFPYDENLEMALAENKEWCKKVQGIRKIVNTKKIRTIVSPRATIMGSQLLKAGLPEDEVMNLVIYKGLNQDEINLIKF